MSSLLGFELGLSVIYVVFSDVMFHTETSMRMLSKEVHISVMRVSRLASFMGGAQNHDIRSLAAQLYYVTDSGSDSDFAASFDSDINLSGSIHNVGV